LTIDMPPSLRIIFAGTPDFSVPPLQALLDSGHRVISVYTQPDRPAGRGRKLAASPVKQVALEYAIPVYQPASLKGAAEQAELAAQNADLMVVVAYGLLLPQAVLDAPRLGCVNIHASLLPRWRGAAPIQRAIQAGDGKTGITIMQMEAGLDTGPMIHVLQCPIETDDTGGRLHDRLSTLGARALMEALPEIAAGSPRLIPQDDSLATYARKLSKDDALLDWRRSAAELEHQVRAFDPWPVAQTRYDGDTLRVWSAHAVSGSAEPGRVATADKQGLDVGCGDGLLRITRLQLPGKKPVTAADFLNAHDPLGALLE
jgi:methionyl-tRNA formyltransferase